MAKPKATKPQAPKKPVSEEVAEVPNPLQPLLDAVSQFKPPNDEALNALATIESAVLHLQRIMDFIKVKQDRA